MESARRRDPTKKNVALLALCQGLAMSGNALVITVTALVGQSLAENPAWATLPFALQFVGVTASTTPASLFMQRFGRRAGFSIGAFFGIAAGLVSALAIFRGSFALFCVGALLIGVAVAHAFYYRFAAADTASDGFRSRAISLVLAGGVVAAFLGPQLAVYTRDLLAPVQFAGGYLAFSGLWLGALLTLQFIEIPRPAPVEHGEPGRPLAEIARQPGFIVAAACAMAGYGAMNLVMTSTPLAIIACGHPFESTAFVIQWHVVAMFAPSFFTGNLIHRFGVLRVLATGALLILGCVAVNLSGVTVTQFWAALVLLGLGWNFMFVGGTTLLIEAYRPAEKAKAQALNEFLVSATVAMTALGSGALYGALGWQAVNLAVVAPVVLAAASALWLGRRRRAVPA